MNAATSHPEPRAASDTVQVRLTEAEDVLTAIRRNEVDAVVVEDESGSQIYTLHSAEEPYRLLVEQMREGAIVLTPEGMILYANSRFAALVGAPLESLPGSRVSRFVAADGHDAFVAFLKAGSGRQAAQLIDAEARVVNVSLSLSTTPLPRGDHLNLVITDLTELIEAEVHQLQAEHDNRTKDQFLAMLAHELRSPLAAMSAAAEVIWLTHADGPDALSARGVLARQMATISRLVTDLLDVERVVSGKLRLDRQPLDIAQAVRRGMLAFTADERFNWIVDAGVESAWVDVDAVRIEQVLTNLVTNALKYTAVGGRISVTVRAAAADVYLSVTDTGLGISSRLIPYIFDLYTQADRTLDRCDGGLGIGLALVRKIVELHGGTISASSEGEGCGSTFVVRLNRIPPSAQPSLVALPVERRAARRVLLIEDSTDAREMLRTVLELAGHKVYAAPDGPSGLELWDVVHPDVGIIDINLPMMNGYEIARRIRSEPHGQSMLLLALSGNDAVRHQECAGKNGFDHHLVKPVDLDYLARLMMSGVQPQ
jgi:PAS domain S-box-containing protein